MRMDRDDLAGDPFAADIRVLPGQFHEVPVVLAHLLVKRQERFGLTGAVMIRPFPSERKVQEPLFNGISESARTEVDADPNHSVLVGEDVNKMVSGSDRSKLVACAGSQAVAFALVRNDRPGIRFKKGMINRCITGVVGTADTKAYRVLDAIRDLTEV